MMRSMGSAVSSLRNHQTRMDVIGNNVANVNTVAFKRGRVTFKDTYSQLVRGAAGSSEYRGGMNPYQVGLGMTVSSIDNAMESGNIDNTGIGTDLFIQGEGFFKVKSDDGVYYTRDGNFRLDEEGYLVTADGRYLQGYKVDDEGNIIEVEDRIRIPIVNTKDPRTTNNIALEGTLDSRAGKGITGTWPSGDDVYNIEDVKDGAGNVIGKRYSLKEQYSENKDENRNSIRGGMIDTKVYDSLGGEHVIHIDFIKATGANSRTYDVNVFYVDPKTKVMEKLQGMPQMKFGADGKPDAASVKAIQDQVIKLKASTINGANDVEFKIDLAKVKMFETTQELTVCKNDGYPLGKLAKFEIDTDGMVVGIFNNGDHKALGQVLLTAFANPQGLMKEGDNLWVPTMNSGEPNTLKPGSGAVGIIYSGALESSNVDLGKEFTDMIITQRGFQANSRVITTADQMLEELVNLKR